MSLLLLFRGASAVRYTIVSVDRTVSIEDADYTAYLDTAGYMVDINDTEYILEVEIMSEILGDINISRGDSYPLKLTILSKETGLPLDLTGYEIKLTVNSDKNPVDIVGQICQVAGVVASDQVADKGVVVFTPSSLDTATVGKFYYEIQLKAGSMIRSINDKHKFIVGQDLTKN